MKFQLRVTQECCSVSKWKTTRSLGSTSEGTSCYRCGQTSHKANQFLQKETASHYCKKVAYLKKVWWKFKQGRKSAGASLVKQVKATASEASKYEYSLFHVGKSHSAPTTVEVLLDCHQHVTELDMVATVSVMSQCSYQKRSGSKPVENTTTCLSLYRGAPLTVLGKSMEHIRHGDSEVELSLIIMEGDGQGLLGRNWLEHLCLDWIAVHS